MPVTFVTNRNKFPADSDRRADIITWDRFPDRVPIDFGGLPKLKGVTDTLHSPFEIGIRSGDLAGRRQDGGPSWAGNFAAGEALLFTNFSPGPLEIGFQTAIRGAGAQVNVKDLVEHANVGIAAFDANGSHVGGGSTMAFFSNKGDGSATFVAVLDSSAGARRITRLSFFITVLDSGYRGDSSFLVNAIRLAT
jgi:hypothetical protein